MQIAAITQHGVAGWPTLKWAPLTAGLNAVYGPPRSGKSTLANLLAYALLGKSSSALSGAPPMGIVPGEVFIEGELGRLRVRVYRDDQGAPRLTVAGLDGATADASTMRRLVGNLTPTVLAPLCAVDFRETPEIGTLLSAEFARAFQAVGGANPTSGGRRTAELAARRDLLAQELETRIAGERQASKDLEARCRELDRQARNEQAQVSALGQSLQAAETALAETDARLRYRRLELHISREQPAVSSDKSHSDADEHIARVRVMAAELAQREATVRARLAEIQAVQNECGDPLAETRAWLNVARQLAADLAGEIARLARSSASQQCVCRDAHPRLRPISETTERQLDVLASLVDKQQHSLMASELQSEVDDLHRSQAELIRHLDQLAQRRNRHRDAARPAQAPFSAADAEQLESRRLEIEQQRFQMLEELRVHERKLRDLNAQRQTVVRQRAALLSGRSIEHVQRELASVQRKLEQTASVCGNAGDVAIADDNPARASDFLAQLADGELVRLTLVEQGRRACVVNRAGQTLRVESLSSGARDQVYLSMCLALLSAARRQGIRLPLVLDEPFQRLESREAAALAAVLDDFSRQGHQVVVFTSQQAAAGRLASIGASVREIIALRQPTTEHAMAKPPATRQEPTTPQVASAPRRKTKKRRAGVRKRDAEPTRKRRGDDSSTAKRNDAA